MISVERFISSRKDQSDMAGTIFNLSADFTMESNANPQIFKILKIGKRRKRVKRHKIA